ncbi:MAG: 3-oxoacyl-[acyl-carrier-protein] reductase FabG [Anaerolineales bacterium]|nr:3-oxoacyl-[acyl-carrier-protein] reductase FabG [Anaerolineales bacterium]
MITVNLIGKKALVTGGSRGIGRGISLALSEAGADVAVNYFEHQEEAEEVVTAIQQMGRQALAVQADVAGFPAVEEMAGTVIEHFGHLDILVNNTGITSVRSLLELSPGEWERTLAVNLTGMFHCAKAVAAHMVSRGEGCIINISSASVLSGSGGGPHYTASKGGVNGLTRAMARELAPHGLRVNAVAPAVIESDFLRGRYPDPQEREEKLVQQIPVGRIGQPEDVAQLVVFLASPLAGYVNGQIIMVDGGRTFLG